MAHIMRDLRHRANLLSSCFLLYPQRASFVQIWALDKKSGVVHQGVPSASSFFGSQRGGLLPERSSRKAAYF